MNHRNFILTDVRREADCLIRTGRRPLGDLAVASSRSPETSVVFSDLAIERLPCDYSRFTPAVASGNVVHAIVLGWLACIRRLTYRPASIFSLCCLFVAAVSVHDASLIVVNYQVIGETEQNPVGRWLLEIQDGAVALFVVVKLAGTALVCALLVTLFRHSQRIGTIAVVGLAAFQLMLLCYLTFG